MRTASVSLVLVLPLAACAQIFDLEAGAFDAAPATDGPVSDGPRDDSSPVPIDAEGCSAVGPDEDDDGCVDVSDNCPHVWNAEQADKDDDNVGDLCDPHETMPIDRIVVFMGGFADGFDPFMVEGGSTKIMTTEQDAYFDPNDPSSASGLVYTGGDSVTNPMVAMGGQFYTIEGPAPFAGVYVNRKTVEYQRCLAIPSAAAISLTAEYREATGTIVGKAAGSSGNTDRPFSLTITGGQTVDCVLDQNGEELSVDQLDPTTPTPGAQLGIGFRGVQFRLDWIIVIDSSM